jgi:hypothetical protein
MTSTGKTDDRPSRVAADSPGCRGCREPRPASLTSEDDQLLCELAGKIHDKGLSAPALLWLESLRPVSFLGSQVMHFLNPFVEMLVPAVTWQRLAGILEERAHLERLLRHVEAMASAADSGEAKS